MPEYAATVIWARDGAAFTDSRYSRAHAWRFDGGLEVPASASPHHVRVPLSDPAAVDPEEAFVAALASCHMLFFLSLAAGRGFVVDHYEDAAAGEIGRNADGREAITRVTLRPRVRFIGPQTPALEEIARMHRQAHEQCYLANSVTAQVIVEGLTSL